MWTIGRVYTELDDEAFPGDGDCCRRGVRFDDGGRGVLSFGVFLVVRPAAKTPDPQLVTRLDSPHATEFQHRAKCTEA
jgi:hypothetical protein